jgi:hypothetical protein
MKTIVTLSTVAFFIGAAFAAQPSQAPKPGPELKAYDVWIGEWQYAGTAMASQMGPAGKFSGKQTVRWILNGFFVEFRAEEKGPQGNLEVYEVDWYDSANKTYPYQGYQNNGDMYSAIGTVSGNVWKNTGTLTHRGIQYQIRGVTTIAPDGMSLTWKNEVSADGKTWQALTEGKSTKIKK